MTTTWYTCNNNFGKDKNCILFIVPNEGHEPILDEFGCVPSQKLVPHVRRKSLQPRSVALPTTNSCVHFPDAIINLRKAGKGAMNVQVLAGTRFDGTHYYYYYYYYIYYYYYYY